MNKNHRQRKHTQRDRRPSHYLVILAKVAWQENGWVFFRSVRDGFLYKMQRKPPSKCQYSEEYRGARFKVKERMNRWSRRVLRVGRELKVLVSSAFVGNGIRRAIAYATVSEWEAAMVRPG